MRPGLLLTPLGVAGIVGLAVAGGGAVATPTAAPDVEAPAGLATPAAPAALAAPAASTVLTPAARAASTPVTSRDEPTVSAHRRRTSRAFLQLQEAAIGIEAATRDADRRAARTAWRRADVLRARLGIGRSEPVAVGLRTIAARLPAPTSPTDFAGVASLARTLGDDTARLRRARLVAPLTQQDVLAEPRRILELASGELSRPSPVPGSQLDALDAALGTVRAVGTSGPQLDRAAALLRRARRAGSPTAELQRPLAAAVGGLLEHLAAFREGA